jgi:hypothetical protein
VRRNAMDIPLAMDFSAQRLSKLNGNKPVTREEVIEETLKHGKWSRGSIMPDDFCYNRKNKGSRPNELCIFLTVNSEKSGGPYVYKGRGYTYTGTVSWA